MFDNMHFRITKDILLLSYEFFRGGNYTIKLDIMAFQA